MPEEPKKPSPGGDRPADPGAPKEKPKHETLQGKRASGVSAVAQEAKRLESAVQKPPIEPTDRLPADQRQQIPGIAGHAFGSDFGAPQTYRVVPLSMASTNLPPETPRWRIELEGLGTGIEPVGLDVLGDTYIGRGKVSNQSIDLDMDEYGGLEQGVSRRHAMLRPTANHLYIIDLGSTNGTMHNGLPLGPGITRALKHNDSVTLGRLSFTVKIIDGPGLHRTAPPPLVDADAEPTRRDGKPLRRDARGRWQDPAGPDRRPPQGAGGRGQAGSAQTGHQPARQEARRRAAGRGEAGRAAEGD